MPDDLRLREVIDADVPVSFEQHRDRVASDLADVPRRDRAAHEAHWAKLRADPVVRVRTIVAGGGVAGRVPDAAGGLIAGRDRPGPRGSAYCSE